jgi:8-oxo-dGTP pyrophosphatase MutT (NUDIX family)
MSWDESRGNIFLDQLGKTHVRTHEPVMDRLSLYALVVRDDSVLMVFPQKGRGLWELPGGGVDPGETIQEGIARECLEETGYSVFVPPGSEPFISSEKNFYSASGDYWNAVIRVYLGTLVAAEQDSSKINSAKDDPDEIESVAWKSLRELSEENVHPIHWEAIRQTKLRYADAAR